MIKINKGENLVKAYTYLLVYDINGTDRYYYGSNFNRPMVCYHTWDKIQSTSFKEEIDLDIIVQFVVRLIWMQPNLETILRILNIVISVNDIL